MPWRDTSLSGKDFRSFTIPGPTIYVQFQAESGEQAWGFR
jgi:hypothetical protein